MPVNLSLADEERIPFVTTMEACRNRIVVMYSAEQRWIAFAEDIIQITVYSVSSNIGR